ncbi:hypothetical protein B0H16DRAFT_1717861 [Mycena metata]|uniref:Uncharacterized protein n=1 Tax=Mycena metata TaxID=1033252 RepID=A0AAD7JKM8_9AGAR|nr:hypothetical protein B0H16DRAFT_1717861 [Mycena metata]
MDKATTKSFYILMHPAIGHLVPLIRRPAHIEAQTPAVLRELLTKALPVFVVLYTACASLRLLWVDLWHRAYAPRALLLPDCFKKIGISLPLHELKTLTEVYVETCPYTANEHAAIAPFCIEPFVRIFTLLHFSKTVKKDTEAHLLPHITISLDSSRVW